MHPWKHPYFQPKKNPIAQSAKAKPQPSQDEQVGMGHDKIGVMDINVNIWVPEKKLEKGSKWKKAKW